MMVGCRSRLIGAMDRLVPFKMETMVVNLTSGENNLM